MARDLGFEATLSDDYYFLSYNSDDTKRIFETALKMFNAGIPIWYDNGIGFGTQWEEIIGEKIAKSRAMLFFFSVGLLSKEESYALKEYRIAKNMGKTIYIILVDNLSRDLWNRFPKKVSFLDDVYQTHFPDDINLLIDRLKKDDTLVLNTNKGKSSLKEIPIKETRIVDSEFLLNGGYFTAYEISKRHVELDYLTIDEQMFPEAIEVEGDAELWSDMIAETADCSANLLVDGRIVGYMDFLPVSPEDYEKLKIEPFSESYVAFYAFGGRFDIFVSMFSIDPNYATPNNYLLFVRWMIEKISSWKINDVNIGKIEFSIYSKFQAKALENLGFKLALTNKLKGMLYETRVSDLLKNRLVIAKFGNCENIQYKYSLCGIDDKRIVNQCLEIASSLSVRNGGIIQYEDAPLGSDLIFFATFNNAVVGYLCLKKYNVFPNGIYVEQVAIKQYHQGLGIGSQLLKNAIEYARNQSISYMFANCKKVNEKSLSLFKKMGFSLFDMSVEQYNGIGISSSDIEKNVAMKIKLL